MTYEEREKRRRAERLKRHKKVMLLRRIIKVSIYALMALIIFLIIWFGIRPAIAKFKANRANKAVTESVVTRDDGNTAIDMTLSDPGFGDMGWNIDDTGWWYKNSDSTRLASGWQTIDGTRYYFTDSGYLATGWQTIDGEDIYFDKSGVEDSTMQLKYVALTFDDGPSQNTDSILDTLEANGAKATFFVVGTQAEYYTDELIREYDLGMQIGSHTYDHTTLSAVDTETIQSTMQKNDELINSKIGITPTTMRPTGGGVNDTVVAAIDRPMIMWDVDTLDWETKDPDNTVNVALSQVQDGSIILMHDLYEATATAVQKLVPALKEAGYKMVTIDELAAHNGYTLEGHTQYYDFYPNGNAYIIRQNSAS